MRTLPLIALAVAASVGCADDPAAPAPGLEIGTQAAVYQAGEPITAFLENQAPEDAYVYVCNYRIAFIVERREGSRWVENGGIDGPICPALYPFGILELSSSGRYVREFELSEPGTYRLRIEYGETEATIGGRVDRSPPFEVR